MRRPEVGLVCVLLVAMAVRLGACVVWADDLARDRDAYLGIARQIAAGHGFCSPGSTAATAYRPPLYPLFLAAVLLVASPAVATAAVNLLAGIGAVVATWITARRTGVSDLGATLAALFVAVDPLLVRYTAQPMTECTFAALTILALGALARFSGPLSLIPMGERARVRGPSAMENAPLTLTLSPADGGEGTGLRHARTSANPARYWIEVLPGVALGLAALCRPTIWPFMVLVCVWMLFAGGQPWRQRAWCVLLVAAGLAVTVAPWVVRNALVFGQPILTTTHGGYTLLLANNPVFYDEVARQPWGTVWSGDSLERWQRSMNLVAAAELNGDSSETAVDRWQSQRAWQYIRQDPSGFAAAVAYRVRSLWSLSPRGEAQLGGWAGRLVAAWYALLFALAAWGLWLQFRRNARWAMVFVLFVASLQAVHLLYWTDTRMRAPLHPMLALLAVLPLTERRQGGQGNTFRL